MENPFLETFMHIMSKVLISMEIAPTLQKNSKNAMTALDYIAYRRRVNDVKTPRLKKEKRIIPEVS